MVTSRSQSRSRSRSPSRPRGEQHPRAKLSDETVQSMRVLHAQGYGYKAIARTFAAPRSTVRDVCRYFTR